LLETIALSKISYFYQASNDKYEEVRTLLKKIFHNKYSGAYDHQDSQKSKRSLISRAEMLKINDREHPLTDLKVAFFLKKIAPIFTYQR
jgi:hypothetical protein